MANNVFANGREISCKKGDGKSICAFPDVCFTPPENPATPPGVPIPYPNTGMAKDTSSGSKKVKISGKEVMLKNKSYFKKSMGDEAGCAAKKGVLTSTNRGKVYFTVWSMDVKVEGQNVVRHLDMTTHNHMSQVGNSPPWPEIDSMAMAKDAPCKDDKKKKEDACDGQDECPGVLAKKSSWLKEQVDKAPSKRTAGVSALDNTSRGAESRTSKAGRAAEKEANSSNCVQKGRCHLKPYNSGEPKCCPGQTAHHIPPKACFAGVAKYNKDKALCVCLEGTNQHSGSHGKNHRAIDYACELKGIKPGDKVSIADYNAVCAQTVETQFGCNKDCIEAQLNNSLKPTNRKITHKPSHSNVELNASDKSAMDKHFGAHPGTSNR